MAERQLGLTESTGRDLLGVLGRVMAALTDNVSVSSTSHPHPLQLPPVGNVAHELCNGSSSTSRSTTSSSTSTSSSTVPSSTPLPRPHPRHQPRHQPQSAPRLGEDQLRRLSPHPTSGSASTSFSAQRAGPSSSNLPQVAPRRASALQEHSRLFRRVSPALKPPKKKKCAMFQRVVVCLPGCESDAVPTKEEKSILKHNGLGEEVIRFESEGSSNHVLEQILSTFKREELQNGFELMAVKSKSRTLLEVVHVGPCSAQDLRLLTTTRIYLRPIQEDLALFESSPAANKEKLRCCFCGIYLETSQLRSHVEKCKTSEKDVMISDDDDDDDEQLPVVLFTTDEPAMHPINDIPSDEEPSAEKPSAMTPPCDQEELKSVLSILKEECTDDTEVGELVRRLRNLFLKGRQLNLPEDSASTEAAMQGETCHIIISRNDVLPCMVDELTTSCYDPRLPLEVEFMGEKGQDLGGPRKEFLRLALNALFLAYTHGPERARQLRKDLEASLCPKKAFFAAGLLMGQCILQDGPTPSFLDSKLVDRLLEGPEDQCEKQLADGLGQTAVLELIKTFPQCRELLHSTQEAPKLTASSLLNSFDPKWAEVGSNRRRQEEIIFGHFIRYIREVEAGTHHCHGVEEEPPMTLEHILAFVTGLKQVPVCGWHPPLTVTFVPQDASMMGIGACTCSHELQLPVQSLSTDNLPSRDVMFDLFNKSFPDEFFGRV